MEHLRWAFRPELTDPVVLAAFEGWNDAGEAASSTIEWFADRWDATPFAEIDSEEFFDFTATRPMVRFEDGERVIDWPDTTISAATIPGSGRDVILIHGHEPHLRWRTFADHVLGVSAELGGTLLLTLGALLAEVPHSRPVNVIGTAQEPDLLEGMGLRPSTYEGPTGIVGVLHARARMAEMSSASLWATVPSYVPGAQSPKATLALVERAATLLHAPVMTTDLEIAAASYERQINELVGDDEETADYVHAIEARWDEEHDTDDDGVLEDPESFVEAVEQFLRDQD